MKVRTILALGLCLAVPASVFADFQYSETTKITGGTIVQLMKFAGTFSKQARQVGEPVTSTVYVKGNRMAHVNNDSSHIIDLDKETITEIDNVHKTYSVMTFQQMKERLEKAQREAKQRQAQQTASTGEQPEMNFKVNVRNTGASKQVAGMPTTESILTMMLEGTDKKTGEKGALAFTNDMWMAPDIRGYSEVRDFNQRLAVKMGMIFGSSLTPTMAAMQPGSAKGMAEMVKEMSKLKGVPVLQIMRMGSSANGQPLPAASEAPLPPPGESQQVPTAGEVAKESAASAVASKVTGGLLGGFGGFGKKKKKEEEQKKQEEQKQEQQKSANAQQQQTAAVLLESNTEITGFSSAPIDASKLEVPAGYKQVEPK